MKSEVDTSDLRTLCHVLKKDHPIRIKTSQPEASCPCTCFDVISLAFSKCLAQVHDELTRVIMHFWSAVCGSAEIREYTSIIGVCIYNYICVEFIIEATSKHKNSRITTKRLKRSILEVKPVA